MISGCPLRCKGCHSIDSWNSRAGELLNAEKLESDISKFRKFITCVLFLGGEWEVENLVRLLKVVRKNNLKTALYTGLEEIPSVIERYLDYIKLGPWIPELGGLDSINTNQRLYDLRQNKCITNLFQIGGKSDEIIKRSAAKQQA
ncbi:MAG: 4Fe-4S cluster-binding domain-containing protein [Oligoflexia bacterium]|nr:4Fe-4S cluster-binding domain-containing protein [Oligoflexia bacterium]